MKKLGLFVVSLVAVSMVIGCGMGGGEISSDQQQAKKDALKKVGESDPNKETRPE